MTDSELIAATRNGDNNAFKQLVERYESQVAATVIGMLGHCDEADDVGQETFIRFYKALDKFREEAGVGTYLTRIAINLSLNEIKRRKRSALIFFRKNGEEISRIPDRSEGEMDWEEKELVRKAVLQLKPEFRSVVVLRLMDGYSCNETAKILKVPLGTALSRLARAQKKLRKILTQSMGEKYEPEVFGTPVSIL